MKKITPSLIVALVSVCSCCPAQQQDALSPLFSRVAVGDNQVYDTKTWSVYTGAPVRATPLVKGQVLFVGNAKGDFYAMDKRSGAVQWKYSTGQAIHSSATAFAGKVFFSDNEQAVYALDEKSGSLAWKFRMGAKVDYPWRYDYYHSSPVIDNGRLLVGGDDGFLYALNPLNGKVIWKFKTRGLVRSTPAVHQQKVIFGDTEATLYAVDKSTGKLIYEFRINGDTMKNEDYGFDRRAITSSAVVAGDNILFGARDGWLYCADVNTGREKWKMDHNVSWVISTVAVNGTVVITGTSDGRFVQAIDIRTGKEIWRQRTSLAVWASPLIAGNLVYAGSFDGQLYCLDVATGVRKSQFKTNGKILSSPVYDDRLLFFGSDDGTVYALGGHPDRTAALQRERYVFYEPGFNVYFRNNADIAIRNYLRGNGYKVVGTDSLGWVMAQQSSKPSVIIFATCYFPSSLSIRSYLDNGGKIVLSGINPALYKIDAVSKQAVAFNFHAIDTIFGLEYGPGDTRTFMGDYPVFPTAKGRELGLPDYWTSSVFIDEKKVDVVLAKNENGVASAYVKKYKNGGQLVQLWMDPERPERLDALLKAAEWDLL